jgi:outer membrane protein OmpA-like peptidoglycan-associated protein
LSYANDGSLASNHLLYIKDKDAGTILDTIRTDENAKYSFIGKPNREYEITTLNGDNLFVQFAIQITPNQQNIDFVSLINGISPKQKADSLNTLWVALEKRKIDSIEMYALNSKFVIHYDFDKAIISNKEKLVLDSLIKKLAFLPKTFISIGAFTDCIGSYKYNYLLSVKRGKAVVDYLLKHGLDKQRITANGYSKKYTISPCITKYSTKTKSLQKDSRRAEVVLSENKKSDWASLELQRGKNYYSVYNANKVKPVFSVIVSVSKDSIKNANAILALNAQKDKLHKVKLELAIQDSIISSKAIASLNLRNENLLKVKLALAKQDSIVKAKVKFGLDLIARVAASKKRTKDSLAAASLKMLTVKPSVIIAKSDFVSSPIATSSEDEDLTKEEILKSLDVLAKLKLEQERIVEYLTKRINKKPILIYISSDSVSIEIYDNGIHDNDSVSVIYNKRIVVDKQELKVNKPIKFKLKVDKESKNNELVFVAENLGTEPPNTGVMFITEKSGRRQQVVLSTDINHNELIYFIRIEKQ